MAFYAHYDAGTGAILGLYQTGMTIPTPNTEITEIQRDDIVEYPGIFIINTTTHDVEVRTLTNDEKWALIRLARNRLLEESDWMVLPDIPISTALRDDIIDYRQALRDLPESVVDPDEVVAPTLPTYVKV